MPKRPWLARHPVLTILIALLALLLAAAIGAVASQPAKPASHNAAVAPSPSPAMKALAASAPLPCHLTASKKRPRDRTTVTIRVRTAAHARVSVRSSLTLAPGERKTGRASRRGTRTVRFRVGRAAPGTWVAVIAHVSRPAKAGNCRAWLMPKRVRRPRPAPTPAPVPTPTRSSHAAPPPASCYPLSDEGTCYEPGEYCRDSDHGASGLAGDGERIACQDNDGWRWEPV